MVELDEWQEIQVPDSPDRSVTIQEDTCHVLSEDCNHSHSSTTTILRDLFREFRDTYLNSQGCVGST